MLALKGAYDFSLAIGGTTYGFILDEDEAGTKAWLEGLAPPIAAQVRDSAFGYQHADPLIDIVSAFEDWHAGAGFEFAEDNVPHETGHHSHRYFYSQGVDMSWGRPVLSPELQTGASTAADATKFLRSQALGTFAIAQRYIRYWSGGAWTESDDAGQFTAYSDIIEYTNGNGQYLIAALAGGTDKQQYKYTGPMITHRATQSGTGGASTTLTVTKPTGTADNDILVATLWLSDTDAETTVITPPSGWTLITQSTTQTDGRMALYWKRASSEGASYQWSFDTTISNSLGAISAYSGCIASGTPYDDAEIADDSTSDTTGETPALPGITGPNRVIYASYGGYSGPDIGFTPPSGFTERLDTGGANTLQGSVADGPNPNGPAPANNFTLTAVLGSWGTGAQVALIPQATLTWTQFNDTAALDESVAFKFFTVRGISSATPVLWGITEEGQIRSSTGPTNEDTSQWSAADQIGQASETVNGMRTVDDYIYIFKAEGIYKYDGTNVTFLWPAGELRSANNGKHHALWSNKKIYVNYGNALIEITPNSGDGDLLRVVFPAPEQATNATLNGEITAITPGFTDLWFIVNVSSTSSFFWKGNPERGEYHTVFHQARKIGALLVVEGGTTDDGESFHATNPVLLSADWSQDFGSYHILPLPGLAPWEDSSYRFQTTQGVAYGPFVPFGTKAFNKFLSRGEIVADDTSANDTIALQYQTPGGTATTIATANTDGLTAADLSSAVSFQQIRYVLLLDNTDNTTSPVLDGVALHASAVIPRKRIWHPRIRVGNDLPLLNGARDPQSASTLLSILETAVGSFITLTDPFGRSRLVRLVDFQSLGMRKSNYGGYEGQELVYELTLVGLETV